VRALRDAIEQALSDDAAREQRGQRGRAVVEEEYTLERVPTGYMGNSSLNLWFFSNNREEPCPGLTPIP
jgi:hypothetical protein